MLRDSGAESGEAINIDRVAAAELLGARSNQWRRGSPQYPINEKRYSDIQELIECGL